IDARARIPSASAAKSITNWPETGSTTLPLWRNATRDPEENAEASRSGFDMPETCFCIASSDCRIVAGRTRLAQSSRIFLICSRSAKEYCSADATRPARSHDDNCRGVMRKILSKSARVYAFTCVGDSPKCCRLNYQETWAL